MTLEYDREIFAKYRNLAITDVADLKIGNTYYTNIYPGEFVVYEIISDYELDRRRDRDVIKNEYNLIPTWIVIEPNYRGGYNGIISLYDRNIGESYNPWLIFDNAEVWDQCLKDVSVRSVQDE